MVVTGRPEKQKPGKTFRDIKSSRWFSVFLMIIFLAVFVVVAWIWISQYF